MLKTCLTGRSTRTLCYKGLGTFTLVHSLFLHTQVHEYSSTIYPWKRCFVGCLAFAWASPKWDVQVSSILGSSVFAVCTNRYCFNIALPMRSHFLCASGLARCSSRPAFGGRLALFVSGCLLWIDLRQSHIGQRRSLRQEKAKRLFSF